MVFVERTEQRFSIPPEFDFQRVDNRDLAVFLQSVVTRVYYPKWPLLASLASGILFRQTKILPKEEIDQLFAFVRDREILAMKTIVIRGKGSIFLTSDAFLVFASLCWMRREMFRGRTFDISSLAEKTAAALGEHPLHRLLKAPSFQEKQVVQQPTPIVKKPVVKPEVHRRNVWDRERVKRLLETCPDRGRVIDYNKLQFFWGAVNVFMCIDWYARGEHGRFVFRPAVLTNAELRRALTHCSAVFEVHPELKTIVDIFFFVRARVLKKQIVSTQVVAGPDSEVQWNEEPSKEELEDIEHRLKNQVY